MNTASETHKTAVLLMVASSVLFGFMTLTIRFASLHLHPFEVAFFRNFFGLFFTLPLFWHGGLALLKTGKLRFYLLRCAIGMVSMLCGFWAIAHLPLAQAVALSYSTPLFVTIGAVLVLGEIVRIRRWTAVIAGFIGVMIIVRPGTESFSSALLIPLLAAALSAGVSISIKFLSRTESPNAIVVMTSLIWTPMSLLPALPYWQWPQAESWAWLVLTGFFGTAAHLCWTRAFKLGEVSSLTPISFVQLPIVATLAWLLFDETIDCYMLIGSAVIFSAVFYIAHREARLARRTVTDPEVAGG